MQEMIKFRASQEQKNALFAYARVQNTTVSKLLRRASRGLVQSKPIEANLHQDLLQLRRLANTILETSTGASQQSSVEAHAAAKQLHEIASKYLRGIR